jgi:streptogramin lyase
MGDITMRIHLLAAAALFVSGCGSHAQTSAGVPPLPAGTLSPAIQEYDFHEFQYAATHWAEIQQQQRATQGRYIVYPEGNTDYLEIYKDGAAFVEEPVPTSYTYNGQTYTATTPANMTGLRSTLGKFALSYEQGNPTVGTFDVTSLTFNLFPVIATDLSGIAETKNGTVAFEDVNYNIETLDTATGNVKVLAANPNHEAGWCVGYSLRTKLTYETVTQSPGTALVEMTDTGSVTTYQIPGKNPFGYSLAVDANGNVWIPIVDVGNSPATFNLTKMTPSHVFTQYPLTHLTVAGGLCNQIAIGDSGAWLSGAQNQLIRVALGTGVPTYYTMPIKASYPYFNTVTYAGDGNVYLTGGTFNNAAALATYLDHRIFTNPTKEILTVGQQAIMQVTERHFNMPLGAASKNISIWTVAQGSDNTHYVITGVSAGTTSIVYSDTLGNALDALCQVN